MKRIYESLIHEYLNDFSAVVILGPRQCGKTTLLQTLPSDWRHFDLERERDYELIAHDPDLFFELNPRHVALDESQLLPSLFPALRVAIDAKRDEPGRFVITGSSSPELVQSVSESLAGRVAIIEMAPLSFAETRQQFTSVFFEACANAQLNGKSLVNELTVNTTIEAIHEYWWRGGYPEPWVKTSPRFHQTWAENYIKTYLDRDIAQLFPGLDRIRFRRFLSMLGSLSGTILNYSNLARALSVSQPTARDYMEIAHGTFVWRSIPAYTANPLKRTIKHPKGYLRDSGLLHKLLHLRDRDMLLAHPIMGASWEGMVIEEILRGLASRGIPFEAFHYRTSGGGEVDLVLEGDFGLLPIEIKHASSVRMQELQALNHFIEDQDCPLAMVINNAHQPIQYSDRILGIPFACL